MENRLSPATLKRLALSALFCMVGAMTCQATDWYWNGNVSQDWADPNNFQSSGDNLPGLPQLYDNVWLEAWAVREPLLTNNNYAPLLQVFLSKNMTITASGELDAGYSIKVGYEGSATLNVAGIVSADNHLDVGGYNGGTATLNVTGGSMSLGGFYLNLNGVSSGASYVNLTGGTITQYGPLSINSSHPAVVNLAGGTLIMPASNQGNVAYWINNFNIVAYNGGGTVNVDTTSSPGNIVLTGVAGAPITTRYWNGNDSQDWSDPFNFQSQGSNLPGIPTAGNAVFLESWAAREPLINHNNYAALNAVYLSKNMTVASGGELDATYFKVGYNNGATLNVSNGTVAASNLLDVGGYNGGTAKMNVTNGTINVGSLYLDLSGSSSGVSYLNLVSGTLTDTGTFSLNEAHPSLLNMAGGTLVVPSSQWANLSFWMNDGTVSAYGVAGTTNNFHIDQTSVPGSLVITSIYPGFAEGTFAQWDPQALSSLPSSLDQAMPLVPAGLAVLTNATYSFGAAVYTNGDIYFTENANSRVQKVQPRDEDREHGGFEPAGSIRHRGG